MTKRITVLLLFLIAPAQAELPQHIKDTPLSENLNHLDVQTIKLDRNKAGKAENNVFTGTNIFNSTFTVQSGGADIILATSAYANSFKINGADGVISFDPEMHNSSTTVLTKVSVTQTSHLVCLPKSTVTINTSGGSIYIWFTGATYNASASNAGINYKIDGTAFIGFGHNIISITGSGGWRKNLSFGMVHPTTLSAGSHSFCLSVATSAGTEQVADVANGLLGYFGVMEIK